MKRVNGQTGFTLLELLIVIAIIAILVSMVLMATMGGWTGANVKLTKSTIALIESAMDEYRDFKGVFPDQNDLQVLNDPKVLVILNDFPDKKDEVLCRSALFYYLLNSVPDARKILERIPDSQLAPVKRASGQTYYVFIDAWKMPLDYRYAPALNNFPLIISAGPDKDFTKTSDNITNRK
jgi:prepilin-type N-terminal cleavage/methylation domain-containing protein